MSTFGQQGSRESTGTGEHWQQLLIHTLSSRLSKPAECCGPQLQKAVHTVFTAVEATWLHIFQLTK